MNPQEPNNTISAPTMPKQSNITVISMAVFVILSLSAVAFLWYQNQQLKKMILSYQTQIQPTPDPLSSGASAKDETSDWKTYTNEKYKLSFKYPKNYNIVEVNNYRGVANKWALKIEDTEQKLHGVEENNIINKPVFDIILKSSFIYNPKADTKKSDLKIGDNIFQYFEATNFEMYEVHYFEINNFIVISETENQHNTNPLFDQILSTFKFLDNTSNLTTISKLTYKVPPEWKSISDPTGNFQASYSPDTTQIFEGGAEGLNLNRKILNDNQIGYKSFIGFRLLPYDGGSKTQFILKYLNNGQSLTSQEKTSNYKETGYNYDGKICLILNGISISQFAPVWGMCDAGNGKAFLIQAYDPNDYLGTIQTLKMLK